MKVVVSNVAPIGVRELLVDENGFFIRLHNKTVDVTYPVNPRQAYIWKLHLEGKLAK
jgi:hypothetical protein